MNSKNNNLEGVNQGKTIAIISYLTLIGLIAAIIMDKRAPSGLSKFHIKQSLGISVSAIVLTTLRLVPGIGGILTSVVSIIVLVALVLGILGALKGKQNPLPVVGGLFQKWFSFI